MKMRIISIEEGPGYYQNKRLINELYLHRSFGQMPKVGEYLKYNSEIFDVTQVMWDFDLLIVEIFVEKSSI